jgi:hypothetical protein
VFTFLLSHSRITFSYYLHTIRGVCPMLSTFFIDMMELPTGFTSSFRSPNFPSRF